VYVDSVSVAVPQGLSITAVRGLGNSFKRRAVQMDPTSSPNAVPSRPLALPAPDDRFIRSSLLEMKRQEQRRRAEMLEAEHRAKMQLLRVEHETAVIRRRVALLDEARALGEARAMDEASAMARDAPHDAPQDLSPGTPGTTPTPSPARGASRTPPADEEPVVANGINGKTDGDNHDDCDGHDGKE